MRTERILNLTMSHSAITIYHEFEHTQSHRLYIHTLSTHIRAIISFVKVFDCKFTGTYDFLVHIIRWHGIRLTFLFASRCSICFQKYEHNLYTILCRKLPLSYFVANLSFLRHFTCITHTTQFQVSSLNYGRRDLPSYIYT